MYIRFWGTRGSIPTPGDSTVRYGGNTSCIELRTDDGSLFILDCGTGLRLLGQKLLQEPLPIESNILLSHTHWDHTQGFAFFDPVFEKGNRFTIFAVSGVDRSLFEVLAGQMDYLYFPLALEELGTSISFKEIGEETFTIGDVQIRTQFLNHTVLTLGFRITAGGATVVYVADHEPSSSNWGAGLFTCTAMRDPPFLRWGHSRLKPGTKGRSVLRQLLRNHKWKRR